MPLHRQERFRDEKKVKIVQIQLLQSCAGKRDSEMEKGSECLDRAVFCHYTGKRDSEMKKYKEIYRNTKKYKEI